MPITLETDNPARPPRAQDGWIEAYLENLERWRISLKAGEPVRSKLCEAWRCYGQYRRTGDPLSRWSAWHAIQTAGASLAQLGQQSTIT